MRWLVNQRTLRLCGGCSEEHWNNFQKQKGQQSVAKELQPLQQGTRATESPKTCAVFTISLSRNPGELASKLSKDFAD